MSTLTTRDRKALLVVDVQHDVVAQAWQRDAVVGRIADLVDGARAAQVPVVWIRHNDPYLPIGSPGWRLVDGLSPAHDEPQIDKSYGDSFADTDLEPVLAELGVGHILLCGAQTDACITATFYGAVHRGYDVTLVADAHTTDDSEFDGHEMPAALLAAHLLRVATYGSWPGVAVTATAAADVTW